MIRAFLSAMFSSVFNSVSHRAVMELDEYDGPWYKMEIIHEGKPYHTGYGFRSIESARRRYDEIIGSDRRDQFQCKITQV